MPVNLFPSDPASLHTVGGVLLGIAQAGIRSRGGTIWCCCRWLRLDNCGVSTRNRFCAAPVQVCREHLAAADGIRALVINTGNANAGTGADGSARARRTCSALARLLKIDPQQVLPFSTGVIMETLPVERIEAGLPAQSPT